jgi:hypothetical protein
MAQTSVPAEDKIDNEPVSIPSEGRPTLQLADLDDADDGPIAAGDLNADTLDRKGRRSQWRELKEERERDRQRAQALEREVAELRGRLSVPMPQQQIRPTGPDPVETEIEGLWEQQQLILRSIQAPNATQAEVDRATEQWRKLERQRQKLTVKQALRESGAGPEDEEAAQDRVVNQLLRSEFPEIFNSAPMVNRALAEMQELMQVRGRPKSPALAREACERVAERYGLRRPKPAAPTESQQARYTSVPSRAGTSGSASGTYTPSLNALRTARAYTKHLPDLSDEERVRRWYLEVGKPNGLTG